jgi:hypothetical protein
LTVADTGEYEVTVTNSCALKTTAKFKVRLSPVLSITKQPDAKTVNVGEIIGVVGRSKCHMPNTSGGKMINPLPVQPQIL